VRPEALHVEINDNAADAYERLSVDRRRTLVAPEDDMWATFADLAEPHALTLGTRLVGRFSVDEEHQLHAFYVSEEFETIATDLFVRVVHELSISAAMASTVDPMFLSLSLTAGGVAAPVALLYDHVAAPQSDDSVDVRIAASTDHAAAVAFNKAATGAPDTFLTPYLAERIDLHELYLVESGGTIVATGECRADHRAPGNAHLGLVVGTDLRGHGMGIRLMHTLTEICTGQDLTPRCSTEPSNVAAQRVIRRAGFRNRHQVFRVALPTGLTTE
jgi:GNAT superfamily N-acetyltransferase